MTRFLKVVLQWSPVSSSGCTIVGMCFWGSHPSCPIAAPTVPSHQQRPPSGPLILHILLCLFKPLSPGRIFSNSSCYAPLFFLTTVLFLSPIWPFFHFRFIRSWFQIAWCLTSSTSLKFACLSPWLPLPHYILLPPKSTSLSSRYSSS